MKKKLATVLLSATLLYGVNMNAIVEASNDSIQVDSSVVTPFYDYVSLLGASISIGTLGKSSSSGFVFYTGNYNSTLTIELQRKIGKDWSAVKSWSKSFTGKGQHTLEEDYYVTSGYTYRVVTTAVIKNGSTILETASSTSSEVSY